MADPFTLIEHQTRIINYPDGFSVSGLNRYLDEVWQSRIQFDDEIETENVSVKQPFLFFSQDFTVNKPTVRAGKYVGFVQYEGLTIQIIPKLFTADQADKGFKHLLWWLSYSLRVRFPFINLLSDIETTNDFPEALISYFARYAHQLVSSLPYHQYEQTTDKFSYLKGRLNTQQYINTSLSRGNWHELVCDYEPFVFNNRLNQIIKYVARKLTYLCKHPETHRHLEKLIFILDDVDNCPASVQDCDELQLSRFYQDYESCLGMCRFFLVDSYLTRTDVTHQNLCFLVPMDNVYEDFVSGVIRQHFGAGFKKITPQATNWLTDEKVFQIRNDLLLTYSNSERLIVDTKYKLRHNHPDDPKVGVSQTDLYQMVSYALRQNTRQVVLLYPVAEGKQPLPERTFSVNSELMGNQPIYIRAVDLIVTGATKQDMLDSVCSALTAVFDLSDNL